MLSDIPVVPYDFTPSARPSVAYIQIVTEVKPPRVVVRYDASVMVALKSLVEKVDLLSEKVSALLSEVKNRQDVAVAVLSIDDVDSDVPPTADQIQAIRDHFASSGDETVYPSDLVRKVSNSVSDCVDCNRSVGKEWRNQKGLKRRV